MATVGKWIATAAFALFCTAPAWAAPKGGITYDCDTASGHFSELDLPAPGDTLRVTGRIQANQIAPADKWSPIARVALAQTADPAGKTPSDLAGFVLYAFYRKDIDPKTTDPKAKVQMVKWDERSADKSKDHEFFGMAAFGETLDFSIALAKGTATVKIGGEEHAFALNAPDPMLRVICSTGEFLITDLRIERPAAP